MTKASPVKANAKPDALQYDFVAVYDNGDVYVGYGKTIEMAYHDVAQYLDDDRLDLEDVRVYRIVEEYQPVRKDIGFQLLRASK